MFNPVLDLNHERKALLEEKELFLLYTLLRKKVFSTWDHLFEPKQSSVVRVDKGRIEGEDPLAYVAKAIERRDSTRVSSADISYFIALGKEFDSSGFSISCTSDFSLVEGGFLSEYLGDEVAAKMQEYVDATDDRRKQIGSDLSSEQVKALNAAIKKRSVFGVLLSGILHPAIEEYREAIINKQADEDFIHLVNKLILKPDTDGWDQGGRWNTQDVEEFLEVYYRHNKQSFGKNIAEGKGAFYEDHQTRLAHLIFDNADFRLEISNTVKLVDFLDGYIQLFQQDCLNGFSKLGLSGSTFSREMSTPLIRKFFGYRKQKQILMEHIDQSFQEYQRNDLEIGSPYFVPEYIGGKKEGEFAVSIGEVDEDEERFLFVHTMLALEHEKQLKVEGCSYGPTELFDHYDRGFLFQVLLKDEGKQPKGILFEGYDREHNLLRFAGQEIELSKKGKETDAVLLLETLQKSETSNWVNNDEIYEDWGWIDVDLKSVKKNKIYHAAKKINNAVELKTQIGDFLEYSTSKARINPKYRKLTDNL